MRRIILNNIWAKLFTLIFAIVTWFYIFDLMNVDHYLHRREMPEMMMARYNFAFKEVPIKPVFYGRVPRGYRVDHDSVRVEPSKITIFGPKAALDRIDDLRTERIDLREFTASVHLRLGISSDIKYINLDKKTVDVYVPVEKT